MGTGENKAGSNDGWSIREISINLWITKGSCCCCAVVVSRVVDAFDKNATGVSALQQAYAFVLMATFSPTECLIAPVSYLLRAAPDGMEPHADFGLLRHLGKRGPLSWQVPGPVRLLP